MSSSKDNEDKQTKEDLTEEQQLEKLGTDILNSWKKAEKDFLENVVRPWENKKGLRHQAYRVELVSRYQPFKYKLCVIMDIVPVGQENHAMFTNLAFCKHFGPFSRGKYDVYPRFHSTAHWEKWGGEDADAWDENEQKEKLEEYRNQK